MISILPSGTVPASSIPDAPVVLIGTNGMFNVPVIQVHSTISLQPIQTLVLPSEQRPASSPNYVVRFLTASSAAKAPMFCVSSPSDRATATADGQTIWMLKMHSWGEQLDELVENETYEDALALLETVDKTALQDKVRDLLYLSHDYFVVLIKSKGCEAIQDSRFERCCEVQARQL